METESADEGEIRVLVVDDEAPLARAMQKNLGRLGLVVEIALDGATALERLKTATYDVMVLDLQLPNMDGLEVFRAARELPAPPATILHSGYLNVRTAVLAIRSGIGEVLEKPVPEEVLVAKIRELADARRAALAGEAAASSHPLRVSDSAGRPPMESGLAVALGENRSLPDLERSLILQAFAASGQNLSRAARSLGIPRSTLRDRLRKYGAR